MSALPKRECIPTQSAPEHSTKRLRRICVFCGSSVGARREYAEAARELGRMLARRRITLVYGGGAVGLMGILANACLDAGGSVIGVIPQSIVEMEVAHSGLTELHIVGSMHERKAMMHSLSEAFIAMPGGLGTFEELFEILTWAQLGIHEKPIGLLNVEGYWSPLQEMITHAVEERFLRQEHADLIRISTDPGKLLELLEEGPQVHSQKWLDLSQT